LTNYPVSSFPYLEKDPTSFRAAVDGIWSFRHGGTLLGYIPRSVFERIQWDAEIWLVDRQVRSLELRGDGYEGRSRKLAAFLEQLRRRNVFGVLAGWRDELYSVYGRGREVLMGMERSATPLFGVVTYGVHMTAYVKGGAQEPGEWKIWAPRRAMGKQMCPGMLDNTVAGGVTVGEKPLDCLVREAKEEASLPEEIVRRNARACGTVTYFHVKDDSAGGAKGLCQPECQYVYDLELSADVVPMPDDNEAEDFRLLEVEEVKTALAEGKFKANCALVLLDFFVRHGILTPENEPDYIEIVSRFHRRLEFPTA
jgi:8-oxo-dGTP pyrophosphatase MutT (NUDIX family)